MTPDPAASRGIAAGGEKQGTTPEAKGEQAADERPRRLPPSGPSPDFEHALRLQMAVVTGE